MKKMKIIVCMGSSCFARGNSKNIKIIEDYINKNKLNNIIILEGALCMNKCNKGPNMLIDDYEYNEVEPDSVVDLLNRHLR